MVVITQKRANYMLRDLWKLPLNPIYYFLKHFCTYTSIFTFASTIAFWHAYPFVLVTSGLLFYSGKEFRVVSMMGNFLWFLCVVWIFFSHSIYGDLDDYYKSVQKMRDVRIGLTGMLISVWLIIASVFTRDSLNYWKTSYTGYHIAMISWPIFMMMFASCFKIYFLQIDLTKISYHRMLKFISVIGIIHVSFAAYFIQWSLAYFLTLILTIASFFFCVDLYTVMTAKSYKFRQHYHYDYESQEILYHEGIVQTPDGRK